MNPTGKGGWKKGESGNPNGRKARPVEQRYLDCFKKIIKPSDVDDIIKRALRDAKLGDDKARKFIFDYLIGPPIQKSEVSGADGRELIFRVVHE